VLAAGHQQHFAWLMIVPRTFGASLLDRADRAAQEVATGAHEAPACQCSGLVVGGRRHDRHSTEGARKGARATAGGKLSPGMDLDPNDPTVLWRMARGRNTAHATIFPGPDRATVTWFFDGRMDRAENYETVDLAMARADHIRSILIKDGWKDA
jgi:hypothetical protein